MMRVLAFISIIFLNSFAYTQFTTSCNIEQIKNDFIAAGCVPILENNTPNNVCWLYFLNTTKMTWTEARDFAESLGSR